ncbi:MAG: leucyl/phenylalanyl-tRNA--protein transferase [Verrucomicrobia bacterium]|nr:leucyl/phenylalanyl-tRNA--protein transferase [Verrucomicrobiota bacterium]
MRYPVFLDRRAPFPNPAAAPPDGLVAVGGDLAVPRLQSAYRTGVFPWTTDPVTWWSPDPRAIFELERFHVPRSLRRALRVQPWRITHNQAFRAVIEGCAQPAPGRRSTWVTPAFIEAYCALQQAGQAHSVECWLGDQLVGGLYGVACGGLFAGESMFHRVDDASKVALCHLVEHLRSHNFTLFDIQMLTPITLALGAVLIPRTEYLGRLAVAIQQPRSFG